MYLRSFEQPTRQEPTNSSNDPIIYVDNYSPSIYMHSSSFANAYTGSCPLIGVHHATIDCLQQEQTTCA